MDSAEVLHGTELQTCRWRIKMFLELGFGDDDADLLGNSDVDWHEAAYLLVAGCPHPVAVRILT